MPELRAEDSKVVKMIRNGLKSVQIDSDGTAKQILSSNAKFQVYVLEKFKPRFSKIKHKLN